MVRPGLDEELRELHQYVRPGIRVNDRMEPGMSERISSNHIGG
jgi:hypothetical protein